MLNLYKAYSQLISKTISVNCPVKTQEAAGFAAEQAVAQDSALAAARAAGALAPNAQAPSGFVSHVAERAWVEVVKESDWAKFVPGCAEGAAARTICDIAAA